MSNQNDDRSFERVVPAAGVAGYGLTGVGQRAVPAETAASCFHDWVKQPDGSQLCWKCGAEKAAVGGNRVLDEPGSDK
jgi:hypothetical protein